MSLLSDSGALPTVRTEDSSIKEDSKLSEVSRQEPRQVGTERLGEPWFEEMIEGSELGRLRRRRGGQSSTDGMTKVQWEVLEFDGEDDGGNSEGSMGTGKRKIDDFNENEDIVMRSGH